MKKLFGIMLLWATCVCMLSSCSEDKEVIQPTLSKTELTLYVDQTATLSYSGGKCTWSSDNALVASVNNGVVTAKHVGETIIRANGTSCKVTVKARYTKYQEPYVLWGNSISQVKNHMRDYELLESSSTTLGYRGKGDVIAYIYMFENGILQSSAFATPLTESSYLLNFLTERYVPLTKDGTIYYFCSPDKKSAVTLQVETSYLMVAYLPFSGSRASVDEEHANLLLEIRQALGSIVAQ